MKRFAVKEWMLGLAAAGLFLSPVAPAQTAPQSDDGDGPGRGVARISLMNGDVSVRRGDSGDWLAAAINAPLLVEDRVLTGPGARAEVQLDYYHRIRLAADTEIRLSQLDERQYQIQVARGTATFSALKGGDAQVEVSTPGAALRPMSWGNYRVTVQQDGDALLTVRSGEADVFSPRGTERLRAGRSMQVRVVGSDSEFQMVGSIPRDAWDEFNEQRDRDLSRSKSYNYVSRDIYGAEDLDNNGEWVDVAPYGYSWRPYVAAGWAPYRYGRWSWADYYGWTWVSYDPWGWAPYHYGRWFMHAGNWCWYPGARFGSRHYWSPALVGWIGWNSWSGVSLGIGIGWGAVGWVPLAPFEPFNRWWGRGHYGGYRGGDFYNRTTIVNNTNITNIYRNSRVNNGVTVVNGNDFSRGYVGRPMRVDSSHLASASTTRGALPVAPDRESLRLSDRNISSSLAGRNANAGGERFYSRQTATRVDRVPFDQQRRALEQVAGRTSSESRGSGFASRQTEGAVSGGGWRQADQGARGAEAGRSTGSGSNDWQRFGDPRVANRQGGDSGSTTGRQATAEGSARGGWRTFGDPARSTNQSSGDSGMRNSVGSNRSESPRWSTGGGSGNSEVRGDSSRSSTGGSGASRSESPRWSTGGGSGNSEVRGDSSRSSTGGSGGGATRSESPRWSTGGSSRSETPRSETQRSTPSSSRGRSNDFTSGSMTNGGWSTGGGSDSGYSTRSVPRSAESPSSSSRSGGGYSTGGYSGGSYSGGGMSRSSGGFGNGSTGIGGSSRSSGGGFGGYSGGGMSRSSGGFGGGGGSIGGGSSRSSGGFGGGGGFSGGGASRSSGGGGGGGSRGGGRGR